MNIILKNLILVFTTLLLLAFSDNGPYKDGNYTGISRDGYSEEDYYGNTSLIIEKGKIITIRFFIRDSAKHEFFDEKYEKHFVGNDLYIEQCRNDWKGVQSYPDSLLKYQDPDKIDAITGATWSYNIFKASVKEALMQANEKAPL
jgi:major membrane immunogen (membrane-anchored lipoprotein)